MQQEQTAYIYVNCIEPRQYIPFNSLLHLFSVQIFDEIQ